MELYKQSGRFNNLGSRRIATRGKEDAFWRREVTDGLMQNESESKCLIILSADGLTM